MHTAPAGDPSQAGIKALIARYKALIEQSGESISGLEARFTEMSNSAGALRALDQSSSKVCQRACSELAVRTALRSLSMDEGAWQELAKKRAEISVEMQSQFELIETLLQGTGEVGTAVKGFLAEFKKLSAYGLDIAARLETIADLVPDPVPDGLEDLYATFERSVADAKNISGQMCERIAGFCARISEISARIADGVEKLSAHLASGSNPESGN